MNKKAFTLVEVLLVIVIIGIIGTITISNITEAIKGSEKEKAQAVEKLLKKNLELYNEDKKEDLWNKTKNGQAIIDINELLKVNKDIKMGDCLLKDENSLIIEKENEKYKYYAHIICGKNLTSTEDGWYINSKENKGNAYYETN